METEEDEERHDLDFLKLKSRIRQERDVQKYGVDSSRKKVRMNEALLEEVKQKASASAQAQIKEALQSQIRSKVQDFIDDREQEKLAREEEERKALSEAEDAEA